MYRFYQRLGNTITGAWKGWNMEISEVIASEVAKFKASADENHGPFDHDMDTDIPEMSNHVHKWKRGVLPGQKYLKQCVCGASESVDFETWQKL